MKDFDKKLSREIRETINAAREFSRLHKDKKRHLALPFERRILNWLEKREYMRRIDGGLD